MKSETLIVMPKVEVAFICQSFSCQETELRKPVVYGHKDDWVVEILQTSTESNRDSREIDMASVPLKPVQDKSHYTSQCPADGT